MTTEEKVDIHVFKAVSRAIAGSDNLEVMTAHLCQLLVGTLKIKGCSLFALNPETRELENLGSFGLSVRYLNKGPVLSAKSIARTVEGDPIVVADVARSDQLQYPEEARSEGIKAIVSLPVKLHGQVIGAMRLYHQEVWEVSARDLDSLLVLTEIVGLAMMYTRLSMALETVRETVAEVHTVWL